MHDTLFRIFKSLMIMGLLTVCLAGCGTPPSSPTGLTVTSTNPITLSWNAVSGASKYSVYRGTSSGDISTKTQLATDITGTSYIDTSALTGTTYYYQVRAINGDGSSSASNEVEATASGGSFSLVGTISGTSVVLNWSTISGAASYNLYRGTTAITTSMTRIQSNLTTTTYTDSNVTHNTTYYYQVAAVDSGGTEIQLSSVSTGLTP